MIARGAEGGGHGEPTVGTLPLLAAILDHLSVPVLAAGGVSSGRALAAVLAAGASGAWLGTAFCACTETLSSDKARHALLAAEDTDTVITGVFDIAARYPWPATIPERVLRNRFTDHWTATNRSCPPTATLTRRWQRPSPQTITGWRRSTPDRASRRCEPSVPRPT